MIVIRFETPDGYGLFTNHMNITDTWAQYFVRNNLWCWVDSPYADWNPSMKHFRDVRGAPNGRFGFTTEIYRNEKIVWRLNKMVKYGYAVVRVIKDPEILWEGASGLQVYFLDDNERR